MMRYKRKFGIDVYEKFAYWDNTDKDFEYRWWPVITSRYQRFGNVLYWEFSWLLFRVGISLVFYSKLVGYDD